MMWILTKLSESWIQSIKWNIIFYLILLNSEFKDRSSKVG
jgi:hypothetical protein